MIDVHVILEENGRQLFDKSFPVQGNLDDLAGIDEAVEKFRIEACPQIEKELFAQALERTVSEEKKTAGDIHR